MLSGLRIIEIEGLGPAPFSAMHLADLGADVITVHRKNATGQVTSDQSILDRGKRSIALDLKDPDDLKVVKDLISTADALIEGFRPGVMERLGLGPEELRSRNPKLVYARMTGWGQSGPRAQSAGHDLNYIAKSGALWYASNPGETPLIPPTLIGDIGGGALYLTIGILTGVLNARATGKGCEVDAAIVDGSAHMMNLLMAIQQTGQFTETRGQSLLDGPHWSRCYQCKDGAFVTVQCLEPKFYSEFLELLGLSSDPDFADQMAKSGWPDLTKKLAAVFLTKTSEEWAEIFEETDACVAVVNSPNQAQVDPHMSARSIWSQQQGNLQAAPAPRFDDQLASPKPAPKRGEHQQDILLEISRLKTKVKAKP